MLKIIKIIPGGIGEELELKPGDAILSLNQSPVRDLIDYCYHMADEELIVKVKTDEGITEFELTKEYEEDLGLEFELKARQCRNKCIFCFIDQQPPGLRTSLYVKDDDYRLSFLEGNYITLTNLSSKDIERITEERISPLYVSVHAANPKVRNQLLGLKNSFDIIQTMQTLKKSGICFHGQIVVCPGYNDGEVLIDTLTRLAELGDSLLSLAVVPVGLTKYRDKLTNIKPVDKEIALEVIRIVDDFQMRFLKDLNHRLVYAADEFFVRAEINVPSQNYYEDFAQLENGIGLIRKTLMEADSLQEMVPVRTVRRKVLLLTGRAAYSTLLTAAEKIKAVFPDLDFQIAAVDNSFLGNQISVAGLLAGADLVNAARKFRGWDMLLVPGAAVRAGLFIDDYSLEDLTRLLDKPSYAPDDITDMVNILRNEVL